MSSPSGHSPRHTRKDSTLHLVSVSIDANLGSLCRMHAFHYSSVVLDLPVNTVLSLVSFSHSLDHTISFCFDLACHTTPNKPRQAKRKKKRQTNKIICTHTHTHTHNYPRCRLSPGMCLPSSAPNKASSSNIDIASVNTNFDFIADAYIDAGITTTTAPSKAAMNYNGGSSSSSSSSSSFPPSSLEEQMALPSSLSSRLLLADDPLSFDGGLMMDVVTSDFLTTNATTMIGGSSSGTSTTVSLGGGATSGDEEGSNSSSNSSCCSGSDIVESQQQQKQQQEKTSSHLRRASTSSSSSKSSAKKKKTTKSGLPSTTYNKKKGSFTTKGYKRHFAVHNYTDYSRVRPATEDLQASSVGTVPSISKGGVHNPFPAVLHRMMEDLEAKGFTDLCSWQPHGRAFLIKEPKKFVAEVLPLYFKHSKLSSFQRQLSLYGFKRLTGDGLDRGAYYHPCFLRGRPFLTSKIQRTRVKGTWVRTSSSPHTEPNFYMMDPVRDLNDDEQDGDEDGSHGHSHCESDSCTASSVAPSFGHGTASFCTPTPTAMEKKTVQITFDLCDKVSSNAQHSVAAAAAASLFHPPALPPTSVMATNNADVQQYIQYIDTAMSIVESGPPPATAAPITGEDIPFVPDLCEDAELASFLSDIDLDMDLTTTF